METLPNIIGDWGHVLAAVLFVLLALRAARERDGGPERIVLIVALGLTASWATYVAVAGIGAPLSGVFESLRNGGWLLFMFVLLHKGEGEQVASHPAAVTAIYGVLCGLLVAQAGVDALADRLVVDKGLIAVVRDTAFALRMIVAVGALLLVHHLFTICAPEAQARIGLVMSALVAMWTYDLNLYAISYLAGDRATELLAVRGLAVAMLAPIVALGIRAGGSRRVQFSHTVAFRSLSVVAVALYLIMIATVIAAVDWIAGSHARLAEIAALFGLAAGALFLVPSPRVRSWMKLLVAKHFFQHRYDYRVEWMRFTETVGQPAEGAAALDQRVVKAMADITDSPSGMLLLRDGDSLSVQAGWNWTGGAVPAPALDADMLGALKGGWIVDLDRARDGREPLDPPAWLLASRDAWAVVPLLHFGDLAGAVILARPRVARRLDWEDLDMLRTAGRQVASYIREAQGQSALDDAQRFDEFNRRFAFIMHDIKNLVSQLSLLARNAERHADKPEFRADMVATLQESVGRMNDMLARLSQHNKGKQEEPRATALRQIVEHVAQAKSRMHPVEVTGDAPLALVDPARAEQIVVHLVQNAIDASDAGEPVLIRLGKARGFVAIDIVDKGSGMTADFVRRDLFKPFASSKEGGFGIGAFEARELTRSMGGEIEVLSRPGEGSCFTLLFPMAAAQPVHKERAA